MELTLKDHVYMTGRLDARKQFHVARRLAPVLSGFGAAMAGSGTLTGEESEATLVAMMAPIADAVSKMSDVDCDYILDTCLVVCRRRQDNGAWAQIYIPGKGMLFQDIDMPEMMQLAVATIKENLSGFFSGPQT